MAGSVCNILGDEDKATCETIIENMKLGESTLEEGLNSLENQFQKKLELIREIKEIAKEKSILNAKAEPK